MSNLIKRSKRIRFENMAGEKAIVALGQGVKKDGTLAVHSKGVVDKVSELLRKDSYSFVLFSGGSTPRSGFAVQKTEAEGMMEMLYSISNMQGVSVVLEKKSRDTVSNACFSREIIEGTGIREIDLVTPDHHRWRAGKIFRWVFGIEYKLNSEPSQDFLSADQKIAMQKAERASFGCTDYFWVKGGIKLGDYKQITAYLLKTHPFFNEKAHESFSDEDRRVLENVSLLRKGIDKYSSDPK